MIEYTLSPENTSEHLFKVLLKADAGNLTSLTLSLPSWIPGSYMIRDFAKSIVEIKTMNSEHQLVALDKQSWRVESASGNALNKVELEYIVFARDLSVRSAYINDEYAFCNGTSVFLSAEELVDTFHKVIIDKTSIMPWAKIITAMRSDDNSTQTDNIRHFTNEGYQELIDHPILIGKVTEQSFVVDNTTYHVVFTGEQHYDMDRICTDLAPICRHHVNLFGEMPEKEYYFVTLICKNGYGGLEHRASTILQYPRDGIPLIGENNISKEDASAEVKPKMNDSYQDFLALCSHELFHLWHVKRNKPEVMINPDLSQEVYTPQLWIYEGITSLYDDLALARSGTISPEAYLEIMGKNITRLLRNPGRDKQSIAESSFYAWNKFYKQTASSTNHIVSYYLKGGLVAFGLDVHIRNLSNGEYSLNNVMKILFRDYGSKNIGTPDNIITKICKEEFGIDISPFIEQFVHDTTELPLDEWLSEIGLKMQLRARNGNNDKGGSNATNPDKIDFGAITKDVSIGCKVTQVLANSAASLADLQIDDQIIAINGLETNSSSLRREMNRHNVGDTVTLHIFRDARLLEKTLSIKKAVLDTCYVEVADQELYENWLKS